MSLRQTARLLDATKPEPWRDAAPFGEAMAHAILGRQLDRLERDLVQFRAQIDAAIAGVRS